MPQWLAIAALLLLAAYAATGAGFAAWLLARGLARLDPAARNAPWTFRLVIAPGVVALWPVLAWKLRATAARGTPESDA